MASNTALLSTNLLVLAEYPLLRRNRLRLFPPDEYNKDALIRVVTGQNRIHMDISLEDVIGSRVVEAKILELNLLRSVRRKERRRELAMLRFHFANASDALDCQNNLQLLMDQYFPSGVEKRVCVIVNPHGGRGAALRTWKLRVEPLLRASSVLYELNETKFAGHAIEMGKTYDPARYLGVVFVSGDGTVQEFVSGLLSRPDWRMLVRRSPICSIASGTANVLAVGLRTTQPEYAIWTVLKHKIRPLDAILVSNGKGLRTVALCGVGWGIAGAIAADSEQYRHFGVFRYGLLKCIHGTSVGMGITKFSGTVEYSADVAMDDAALATYFSQPLASTRRVTEGGIVEIGGSQSDTTEQVDVCREAVQQFTLQSPTYMLGKAMTAENMRHVKRGGGRVLGRDSMMQLPDVAGGIVTTPHHRADTAGKTAEELLDRDIAEIHGDASRKEVQLLRPNGGFGELQVCTKNCTACKAFGHLRFVGQHVTSISLQQAHSMHSTSREEDYHFDLASVTDAVVSDNSSRSPVTATPATLASQSTLQTSRPARSSQALYPSHHRRASFAGQGTLLPERVPAHAIDNLPAAHPYDAVSVTERGFEKRRLTGTFVTVGVVNVGPDGAFTHPSDSYADLIVAKRGDLGETVGLLARYIGKPCGTHELDSELLEYVKARTVIITPDPACDSCAQAVNVDGEVLPGPGPFRIHVMPSMLTAFGEY